MSNEKKWVYVTLDGADCKLNILPSSITAIRDGGGTVLQMKKVPAINVIFNNGKAVIDEFFAKSVAHKLQAKVTPETVVEWIESQWSFGKQFICVQSPDKSMTAEELKKLKDADKAKKKGPEVVTGPRGTRN